MYNVILYRRSNEKIQNSSVDIVRNEIIKLCSSTQTIRAMLFIWENTYVREQKRLTIRSEIQIYLRTKVH